jgi:hypothetical protein
MAKAIRYVSRELQTRASQALDLVHIDVAQITPTVYNGYRYTTIFTEDKHRIRWAYTHKDKGGAYDSMCHFNAMAKTQYGKTIKTYQLDGGNEFGGSKFESIC